jgi:hypothetical protein
MAAALLTFVVISVRATPAAKKNSFDNLDFQNQFKI